MHQQTLATEEHGSGLRIAASGFPALCRGPVDGRQGAGTDGTAEMIGHRRRFAEGEGVEIDHKGRHVSETVSYSVTARRRQSMSGPHEAYYRRLPHPAVIKTRRPALSRARRSKPNGTPLDLYGRSPEDPKRVPDTAHGIKPGEEPEA